MTAKHATRANLFAADRPISGSQEDRFDRWPFANRTAETICQRSDRSSLVIGIYGPWGDGKTSTLAMVDEALSKDKGVIVVHFNPWLFQDIPQLLEAFFGTVADAVGKSIKSGKEKVGDLLVKYGRVLSVASASVGTDTSKLEIDPGKGAEQLGVALSAVTVSELRGRISRILEHAKKRVVVLIDDIDRLERDEIHAMLKLVKLTADFQNTVYVLAFDDEMVAAALGSRYGGGDREAGRNFLEKIVQVPLNLPPVDPMALRQLVLEGIDEALRIAGIEFSEEEAQQLVRQYVDGLERMFRTPRHARRFANGLSFALPLLRGEVNPVDQILVEGIRQCYPQLYQFVRTNPDCFARSKAILLDEGSYKATIKKRIEEGLQTVPSGQRESAQNLLQVLFPRLKGIFGNVHFSPDHEVIWEREKRVCAAEYFGRYFGYAVNRRDVSDSELEAILSAAESAPKKLDPLVDSILSRGAANRLIAKLRVRADSVPTAAVPAIVQTIATRSESLPRETGMFGLMGATWTEAAILISQLLRRLTPGETRRELAKTLFNSADIAFSQECQRWLRKSKEEAEEERLLSVEDEEALQEIVARRIETASADKPVYLSHPFYAPTLLWAWKQYGDRTRLDKHLTARLQANPKEATELLGVHLGTAWGLETGLPSRADFEAREYESVSGLVSPAVIADALIAVYGNSVGDLDWFQARQRDRAEQVAHQFMRIHRQRQATPSIDSDASTIQEGGSTDSARGSSVEPSAS